MKRYNEDNNLTFTPPTLWQQCFGHKFMMDAQSRLPKFTSKTGFFAGQHWPSRLSHFVTLSHAPCENSAAINHTVVREDGVSRYLGDIILGPSWNSSLQFSTEDFKGRPQLQPHYPERREHFIRRWKKCSPAIGVIFGYIRRRLQLTGIIVNEHLVLKTSPTSSLTTWSCSLLVSRVQHKLACDIICYCRSYNIC